VNLVTFFQYSFIACHGLIFTSKFFTVKNVIAIKDYIIFVIMFFTTNVCCTNALNFNIPMPLCIVFGAGSLLANLVMGMIILKKRYNFSKYLAVVLITIGIVIYTISSAKSLKKTNDAKKHVEGEISDLFWMSIGILLLTIELFTAARMGIYQESLFKVNFTYKNKAEFVKLLCPLHT
jgi:solute carrier family 35 (UDP-xylose/UDP-N-acetylglucosamine transporter), member B4